MKNIQYKKTQQIYVEKYSMFKRNEISSKFHPSKLGKKDGKTKYIEKLKIKEIEPEPEIDIIKFSKKEKENYTRQKDKCKFKSAEEEYEWAKTQEKKCSKCKITKTRVEFTGNTSGTDAFDRNGYRLLRPECKECKKKSYNGKIQAVKNAKTMNIQHKPPEGTLCCICQEPEKKGDAIVFDHDHLSNTFRGYCHNSCNRSLGVLGDNVEGLIRAINYLNKSEKHKIIQDENGMLKII